MLNKNYMLLAIKEAKKTNTDVPIGAIIVKDDEVIAIQHNKKELDNLVTSHAEILALNQANKKLNSWRLDDCDMYVTLEPCPMCAWAILNSRIKNLYFGSYDNLYGGFSVLKLNELANSKINIKGGILEKENDEIIQNYFKELRK